MSSNTYSQQSVLAGYDVLCPSCPDWPTLLLEFELLTLNVSVPTFELSLPKLPDCALVNGLNYAGNSCYLLNDALGVSHPCVVISVWVPELELQTKLCRQQLLLAKYWGSWHH
jgi:hypothetical protein